jgi:hypothetical protein
VLQLAEDGLNPDCLKKVKDPKLKDELLKLEDESVRRVVVLNIILFIFYIYVHLLIHFGGGRG